jgi:hypothetical protein
MSLPAGRQARVFKAYANPAVVIPKRFYRVSTMLPLAGSGTPKIHD